jgi:hypothetical protein
LRDLPTISAEEFWDYAWDNHSERLRNDFGFEVKSKVRKHEVVALARENRFLVREYLEYREGRAQPVAYDLDRDTKGVYRWEAATAQFVTGNPLAIPPVVNRIGFEAFIRTLAQQYQHFVEQDGGWELLWNDDGTPKPESAAQLLFLGIVKHYCISNDIDFSREVDVGRGSVDFKFSNGYSNRALLEVKLVGNTRFWNGLDKQLPTYLAASKVRLGHFLVVLHRDTQLDKVRELQARASTVAKREKLRLDTTLVDARPKPSASKL